MAIGGGKLSGPTRLIQMARNIRAEWGRGMANTSLQQRFGPNAATALRGLAGGHHAYEISLFKAWCEGIEIEDHAVQNALAQLIDADPHDLLKPAFPEARLFYVDPLLDLPALRPVFPYLEKSTDGGASLELPSLALSAYAAPDISLDDPRDIYALIGSPKHALYLLERVLYVVHRDERHERALIHIQEAIEQGLLSEVGALSATGPAKPIHQRSGIEIPWQDSKALGSLDLSIVPEQIAGSWQTNAARDFSDCAEYPSLQEWLQEHRDLVHASDVLKLLGAIGALWQEVRQGEPSAGQVEAWRAQTLGILGEIAMRRPFLEAYRRAAADNDQVIFLTEGQIRTAGDQRMSLDLALGRLDAASRCFHLDTAVEISVSRSLAERSQGQLQHSLENRFPAKGLAIIDESGQWGRVDVDASQVQRKVVIVPDQEAMALRKCVDQSMTEVLGHLALRRQQHQSIPLAERRRYRDSQGANAAGRLVQWITRGLFTQLAGSKQPGQTHDLHWLDQQMYLRLMSPDFPELAKKYLGAFRVALNNIAVALNPKGERRSAHVIAKEMGVSRAVVVKYISAIEKSLERQGWEILPDPGVRKGQQILAGQTAAELCAAAWKADSIEGVASVLQAAIDETELAEEVRAIIRSYLVVLQNVLGELNPTGRRRSIAAISRQTGDSVTPLSRYLLAIEENCQQRGWNLLPDPQAKVRSGITAGQIVAPIYEQAWQAASVQGVASTLQAAVEDTELTKAARQLVKTYLLVLQNLAAELNSTGKRRSVSTIARETGVFASTAASYQSVIENKLQERKQEVVPDPGGERRQNISAGQEASAIYRQAWEASDLQGVVGALQTAIEDTQLAEETRRFIRAYLKVLQNVSADLNATGTRRSPAEIADESGVHISPVRNSQLSIEKSLHERGWKIVTDPEAQRSQQIAAGRTAAKIVAKVWQAADLKGVVEALQTAIDDTQFAAETRHFVRAYLAVLRNIAADLNPTGKRGTLESMASESTVSGKAIRNYRKDIEKNLQERDWEMVPDPEAKRRNRLSAGNAATKILEEAWQANDIYGVASALQEAIDNSELADEVRALSRAYLALLQNASAALNASGNHRPTIAIANEVGLGRKPAYRYQQQIERNLTARGWKILAS